MSPAQRLVCQHCVVSEFDQHFSQLMERLSGYRTPELRLAAALASANTDAGHVCLHLCEIAGRALSGYAGELVGVAPIAPELTHWIDVLRTSRVVGEPGEFRPLILDRRNRLYLYRYWDYERRLARALRSRAQKRTGILATTTLRTQLSHLFRGNVDTSWQRVAAATALLRRLSVITGGPGTGKTTTVARILAILTEQAGAGVRIALTAPTGKAASRLQQTMHGAKTQLLVHRSALAAIPDSATTIHRLLGLGRDSSTPRYGEQRPLPLDVVVVDEASMIDLALMTCLVVALPAHARLILLGDKDQLASVEAGSVLADICGESIPFSPAFAREVADLAGVEELPSSEYGSPMRDCIVSLQQNFRFGADSGIGALARAVNQGDSDTAIALLADRQIAEVSWQPIHSTTELHAHLRLAVAVAFESYWCGIGERPIEASLQRLNDFRVLCVHNDGPAGVQSVNSLIEGTLRRGTRDNFAQSWYPGRPIMVTRNDYALGLFNGDVGIAIPDPQADGRVRVHFACADGSLRRVTPSRLPEHETVFAATVHKAQGSEFERVSLILPQHPSPLVTRELIYTAITRARTSVEIVGSEAVLRAALSARLQRGSGLRERLWSCTRE